MSIPTVCRKYITVITVLVVFRMYTYILYSTRLGLRLKTKYSWLELQEENLPVFPIDPIRHGNDCMKFIQLQPYPCQVSPLLFLAINSHARHFSRRKSIRNTWAHDRRINGKKEMWKTVFIVGLIGINHLDVGVNEEASHHGDMIILNFLESHSNLTDKTVTGMYWAFKYCRPKFFYKGDDDVWVNKWRVHDYISHLNNSINHNSHHWVGFVSNDNRKPIRNTKSKYYISKTSYKWGLYPPYCSGFANIMSGYVLYKLLDATNYVERLPGIDDVYVGLLAYKCGIEPTSNKYFRYGVTPFHRSNITSKYRYIDQTLALHGITTPQMQILLTEIAQEMYHTGLPTKQP